MIGYASGDAIIHNPEFTRYGVSSAADRAVLDGGMAVAWTAIAMATNPDHRAGLLSALAAR